MANGGSRGRTRGRERLVGRADLVDELVSLAAAARSGDGSVVLLTGEPGIGKTSVVHALTREVRDELVVSWGRCAPGNRAPPFFPWRSAVATLAPVSVSDGVGDAGHPHGESKRPERLNRLRDHLLETARAKPALHVIDDLQWADVASTLLLAQVAAAIDDVPLLVVATLRTGEALKPQMNSSLDEVRRLAAVRSVAPLRVPEVAELMSDLGLETDDELATLVAGRSGGNPLYVAELLRAVRAGDSRSRMRDVLTATVPTHVSDLVAARMSTMPRPVAETVRSASAMGIEGDVAVLAAIRGSSVEATLDLLEQARASGVMDGAPPGHWRFRHDLVRDAIYESLSSTERAREHGAVLDALAAIDDTPMSVLAHHALAARPLFDTERAIALAARAGAAAFDQHGYEEAIAWFDRALEAAPPDTPRRWRAELLVLSGEANREAGATDAARRAFVAAAALTDDSLLLARAALGYSDPGADLGIAYRTEDPVTAEMLDRAIRAQPPDDGPTIVELEARLAAELYFSGDSSRSRTLADSAMGRARRIGDARLLCVAGAVVHDGFVVGQAPLAHQLESSGQLVEWATRARSSTAALIAHRARVFDLLAAGDVVGMDSEILAFRAVADQFGVAGYSWWPSLWAAMRALLEGRHEVAEQRAVATFELGARPFPALAFANFSFLLFFLRREQGRLVEMEEATSDYVASHPDIPAIRVSHTFLLAELGRIDEARVLLRQIHDTALDDLRDRNWPASWFQLARTAYLVGDRDMAAELLLDDRRPTERCVNVSLATACLGATDLAVGWLLETTGDLDAADLRYSTACDVNSAIVARSWLAQTQVDQARMLLARDADGDRDRAARLVAAASAAAREIGLASVLRAVDELGGPVAVAAAPTPNEQVNGFSRAGAVWDLDFDGRRIQIPDGRGLRDIAWLLAHPHQPISVLELIDDRTAAQASRGAYALDDRARREIRSRLAEIDADEADAEAVDDGERAALARERRRELAEAVARDLGLGGRSRRIGDPVERARKTVSTRIRRSIAQIERAHPALGRHLERSIDTGAWCAYRPAEPTTWVT